MSDEKSFSVCQEMLPLFRAVLILIVHVTKHDMNEMFENGFLSSTEKLKKTVSFCEVYKF